MKTAKEILLKHLENDNIYTDSQIEANMDILAAMEEYATQQIDECISVVKGLIRPECSDHTPYYGACTSCGSTMNYDVLPDPEDVIKALQDLKEPTPPKE